MTCSDFLARFSEFDDGELGSDDAEAFHEHVDSCRSCRRYHFVIQRGRDVLRRTSPVSPTSGFRDRLQHSILLLDEERRRRSIPGSGTGFTTFALIAVVAAAMLAFPMLRGGDSGIRLPAIVVQDPVTETSAGTLRDREPLSILGSPGARMGASRSSLPVSFDEPELWGRSNTLLYRYSSLYSKHRESTVVRARLR